jgi:hypothetical protein
VACDGLLKFLPIFFIHCRNFWALHLDTGNKNRGAQIGAHFYRLQENPTKTGKIV